ncbi:CMGC protein [Aspergillus rambellii]|uniref:CMGC protein n=2 Tax=Aspergillus subgen. Nidulantes TaxID=2720870 RepID=A0A0F8UDP7_9EURO|nr:CMGC protein [Aspergillus rambellii]KKK21563.1 CMGC protein [Aspergillus ochraceoroseus]
MTLAKSVRRRRLNGSFLATKLAITSLNITITPSTASPHKGNNMADFGDFVRTEDEELDLEEVVEPWNKYDLKESSRVFYPICVGEVLDERYLIEHKIGSGGFATVWMAHDLQDKRDVALKSHVFG